MARACAGGHLAVARWLLRQARLAALKAPHAKKSVEPSIFCVAVY
jgi:hypothetical protein